MATVPKSPGIAVPPSPMQALAQNMQGLHVHGPTPVNNTGAEISLPVLNAMIDMPLDTLATTFDSQATDALEHQGGTVLRCPAHVAGTASEAWLNDLARQGLDNEIELHRHLGQTAEQNRAAYDDSPTPVGENAAAVQSTAMDTSDSGQVHKKGRVDAQSLGESDTSLRWRCLYVFGWPLTDRLAESVAMPTQDNTGPTKILPISPFLSLPLDQMPHPLATSRFFQKFWSNENRAKHQRPRSSLLHARSVHVIKTCTN